MTKVVVVQLFSLLVSYTSFCDKYVWIWRQNVIQVWHSPPSPLILWTIILLLPLCNFLRFWLKLLLSNFLFVCFKLEARQIKESAELWASQKESKHHPALKSFVSIQFLSHMVYGWILSSKIDSVGLWFWRQFIRERNRQNMNRKLYNKHWL